MKTLSFLVADIGATHSRFAIATCNDEKIENSLPVFTSMINQSVSLVTAEFSTFSKLLEAVNIFLKKELAGIPQAAVFALCGVVTNGTCSAPNIPWKIDAEQVSSILSIPHVFFINDFVAQAYSCQLRERSNIPISIHAIRAETRPSSGSKYPVAVVGAGSGFGKALLIENSLHVLASEGGHADFPFYYGEEDFITFFMKNRNKITSDRAEQETIKNPLEIETIVSGQGVALLYAYYSGVFLTAKSVSAIIREEIATNALAQVTLAQFATFYGRVCKNFVLDTMAHGGLCVTGGVAEYLPVFEQPNFFTAFHDNHTYRALLTLLPIWHIADQKSGLYGAAVFGENLIKNGRLR